jgi:hypothetical protein
MTGSWLIASHSAHLTEPSLAGGLGELRPQTKGAGDLPPGSERSNPANSRMIESLIHPVELTLTIYGWLWSAGAVQHRSRQARRLPQ